MSYLDSVPVAISAPDAGLRRRRDWQTDIPALSGIMAWLSVRDAYIVKDGSNRISQLTDRTGAARHIFQTSSTAKQPLYVTDGAANGTPVARFDGVDDVMQWGNPGHLPTTSDFTKVLLFKKTGAFAAVEHLLSTNLDEANNLYLQKAGFNIHGQVGTSPIAKPQTKFVPGKWHLVVQSFDYSTGTVRISLDGGSVVEVTAAGANTTRVVPYLGGSTSTPANPFRGDIAEVLIFNNDLLDGTHDAALALIQELARSARGVSL